MNEHEAECWFWKENDDVARWWTPYGTGTLPIDPLAPPFNGRTSLRADPEEPCLLETALEPALAKIVAEPLEKGPVSCRLYLDAGLPKQWQDIPFEYLLHRGQRLETYAQIIRYARPLATPPLLPRTPQVVFVDLWPETERTRADGQTLFDELLAAVDIGAHLIGRVDTDLRLPKIDLSSTAVLCVISHGSEGYDERPFRAETGEYWTLPLSQGLPPLVLLLACGDEKGNLLDYGCELLKAGAQAVLAPVGRLDALATDGFLRAFLVGWEAGCRAGDLLWEAQQKPDSDYGARRLRLLGRSDLHRGPARTWAEQPDGALNTAAKDDDSALCTLLERITARWFQIHRKSDAAVDEQLYKALGIHRDDGVAEAALLARLDRLHDSLSRLTASWVIPYIAYLAEVYDHALLHQYESLRCQLAPDTFPEPFVYHYWGKLYYRKGEYGHALMELAKGFTFLKLERLYKPAGIGPLGLLINCMIDLNLPRPGLALYDRLDICLRNIEDPLSQFSFLEKINRLDRQARLALRRGRLAEASIYYREKRVHDTRDPDRERAWLLYIASWSDPLGQEALHLAAEVGDKIQTDTVLLDQIGPGNATLAYLVRTYALWAWRSANRDAFGWLAAQFAHVEKRFASGQDAGPLGFSLAYLHLCRRSLGSLPVALPPWEIAESALNAQGYWLELAIFSALLGRGDEARRFLGKFQNMRIAILPTLETLPDWLADGPPIAWREELQRRSEKESELLFDALPAIKALVEAGLLPL